MTLRRRKCCFVAEENLLLCRKRLVKFLNPKQNAVGVRKCTVGQGRAVSHSNPGTEHNPSIFSCYVFYIQLYSGRELLSKAEAGENHTLF